jgi:hypothetical protein
VVARSALAPHCPALSASSARKVAKDPALAKLIRDEQDLAKQIIGTMVTAWLRASQGTTGCWANLGPCPERFRPFHHFDSSSAISRSKSASCFPRSRPIPCRRSGDRRRSMTPASSIRSFASVHSSTYGFSLAIRISGAASGLMRTGSCLRVVMSSTRRRT